MSDDRHRLREIILPLDRVASRNTALLLTSTLPVVVAHVTHVAVLAVPIPLGGEHRGDT